MFDLRHKFDQASCKNCLNIINVQNKKLPSLTTNCILRFRGIVHKINYKELSTLLLTRPPGYHQLQFDSVYVTKSLLDCIPYRNKTKEIGIAAECFSEETLGELAKLIRDSNISTFLSQHQSLTREVLSSFDTKLKTFEIYNCLLDSWHGLVHLAQKSYYLTTLTLKDIEVNQKSSSSRVLKYALENIKRYTKLTIDLPEVKELTIFDLKKCWTRRITLTLTSTSDNRIFSKYFLFHLPSVIYSFTLYLTVTPDTLKLFSSVLVRKKSETVLYKRNNQYPCLTLLPLVNEETYFKRIESIVNPFLKV